MSCLINFLRLSLAALVVVLACSATRARADDAIEAKVQICASCHGKDGSPGDRTIPIIWGQHPIYLEKQLRDYKNGTRDSQIMSSLADSLKDNELGQVAALFGSRTWPSAPSQTAKPAKPAAVGACAACHGETFMGGAAQAAGEAAAPRLAGQFYDYLVDTMTAFANGERANNAAMTALLKDQTSADREAIARYLSGL